MWCFSTFILFFFSSRRRHTRYIGDWSSDVCSSDLPDPGSRHPALHSSFGGSDSRPVPRTSVTPDPRFSVGAGHACWTARSKRRYRRSKWPLTARVLLSAAVEVMIVLIDQIGGQRVAVNRIGGDPCQRRLFRLALDRLDLNDQGLIRTEVDRLIGDDGPAFKMCVDRHERLLPATSSSMPGTPEAVHFASNALRRAPELTRVCFPKMTQAACS